MPVASGCLLGSHRDAYEALLTELRREPGASFPGERPDGPFGRAVPEEPPATALGERLRLRDALDRALRSNPEVVAILKRWEALTERIPQVGSLEDPQLRYLYNVQSIETRAGPKRSEFLLSQRIPFPGKLALREEDAIAEAQAMREEYRAKVHEVARDVAAAYHELAFVYRAIEINERNKGLVRSLEEAAQSKFREGSVTQQDVIRVQIRRTHLLHRTIGLERDREVAEARLNELLGRRARAALARPEQPAEAGDESSLDSVRRKAFRNRPELASMRQRLRQMAARRRQAELAYFPDLTVGLSYIDIEGGRNPAFGDQGKDAFKLLFGVDLPVFTQRRAAGVREAEASIERVRAQYLALRHRIDREVHEAYETLVEARSEVSLFRDTLLPQARHNLQSARAGYENGRVDLLTVIDAQQGLEDVELEYERSRKAVRVAREELDWAAGMPRARSRTESGGDRRG